jgi:hypothetical protein
MTRFGEDTETVKPALLAPRDESLQAAIVPAWVAGMVLGIVLVIGTAVLLHCVWGTK